MKKLEYRRHAVKTFDWMNPQNTNYQGLNLTNVISDVFIVINALADEVEILQKELMELQEIHDEKCELLENHPQLKESHKRLEFETALVTSPQEHT